MEKQSSDGTMQEDREGQTSDAKITKQRRTQRRIFKTRALAVRKESCSPGATPKGFVFLHRPFSIQSS